MEGIMRIHEVICDGCGKKIEKEIFGLILMEKNADFASGYNWDDPKLGELDFCGECKEKIVKGIRKFAGQEEEFVEPGPYPETDKIFEERQNVAEEKSDREAEKERYRRMSIEELLLKGVPAGDIVKIKGCKKKLQFSAII
jgi:hypothetical protein